VQLGVQETGGGGGGGEDGEVGGGGEVGSAGGRGDEATFRFFLFLPFRFLFLFLPPFFLASISSLPATELQMPPRVKPARARATSRREAAVAARRTCARSSSSPASSWRLINRWGQALARRGARLGTVLAGHGKVRRTRWPKRRAIAMPFRVKAKGRA
jgi:hypothetical protein